VKKMSYKSLDSAMTAAVGININCTVVIH
jgi:hypothetical protein